MKKVELALEGTRYFDLMRWKEMDKAYERCRQTVEQVLMSSIHQRDMYGLFLNQS